MPDPAATAQQVSHKYGINGIPALSLHAIADNEDILYDYCELPEVPEMAGLLVFKNAEKGILINTYDSQLVRQTFTFAHELGHFFLKHTPIPMQGGDHGFRCTKADITWSRIQIEREANAFAVELLMPEHRFRPSMAGAPFDFPLINGLAREYQVSKQTCGYRILELTQAPCAILHSEHGRITMQRTSRAARGFLRQLTYIPQGTAAHSAIRQQCGQTDFTECDPEKWLVRYTALTQVYECTRGKFENGVAMTLLRWS